MGIQAVESASTLRTGFLLLLGGPIGESLLRQQVVILSAMSLRAVLEVVPEAGKVSVAERAGP